MTKEIHRLRVGESLPALMTDADLMRVVGLKKSRFYLLKRAGAFDMFRVRQLISSRSGHEVGFDKPWSGALVQRWLDGGGTPRAQFGLRAKAS